MKKVLGLFLILLVILFVFAGCTKKEDEATEQSTEQEPKWKIGMSQCNLGEPWRVQMNADIKNAAEKYPQIKVIFKDAQNDTLRQRSQILRVLGTIFRTTPGAIFRPCRISAALFKSSYRPLVQEPIKAESIFVPCTFFTSMTSSG